MRVLGLDVSSSTIGYCLLEWDEDKINVVVLDHFKPPKKGSIFERLTKTQQEIKSIIQKYQPDIIAIEDFAKFMGGISTAATIIGLAVFNRAVGLACYELTGKEPILYSVMAIRHGLKEGKQLPKKEDLPSLLEKHLCIKFPYKYKTNRKGFTSIRNESYDESDAMSVALFALGKEVGYKPWIKENNE